MLRTTLQQTHDEWDGDLWADYDALYAGGKKFFARIKRFLHQNPVEPPNVYANRLREAHYRCYVGGIVDYFTSFLFLSPIVVRAKRDGKQVDPDPFYGEFKEDCDGQDNDIHVFLRGRVIEALNKRRSWWLCEMPQEPSGASPQSLQEWRDQGLDRAKIRAVDAEQVLDWEVDDDGKLVWAIVVSVKTVRPSPVDQRQIVVERYDVYDRENIERFELRYDKAKKPSRNVDIPSAGKRAHGFSCVPLVNVDVGDALWLTNRVASPQLEHFRLSNAQTWGIRRTCYAMPVFNLEDSKKMPTMGQGYGIMLGVNEKAGWITPDAAPYSAIHDEVKNQKDEIFRIVNLMALGVDNNAAAVGRSGKSKEVDSAAVKVILTALGQLVREAVERTYTLLSDGRGEEYDWSIEGLDDFTQANLDDLVAAAQGIMLMNIPSPTLHRHVFRRVGLEWMSDAEQGDKDKFSKEIDENVTEESVLNPPVPEVEPPDGEEGAGEAALAKDQPPPAVTKPIEPKAAA